MIKKIKSVMLVAVVMGVLCSSVSVYGVSSLVQLSLNNRIMALAHKIRLHAVKREGSAIVKRSKVVCGACESLPSKVRCLSKFQEDISCMKSRLYLPSECDGRMQDFRDFAHSYNIIIAMHERYEQEFGSVPAAVQKDLEDAELAYEVVKRHIFERRLNEVFEDSSLIGLDWESYVDWELWYCAEMYNKEMNDLFGSEFSPTSDDPFSSDNYVCTTSYEDALATVHKILKKYSYVYRCE